MKSSIEKVIRALHMPIIPQMKSPIFYISRFVLYGKSIIVILLVSIAVIFYVVGCEWMGPPSTPIFAETDLMYADYSDGKFNFSPSRHAQYLVLGVFGSTIVTSRKTIMNMEDMEGGSSSEQLGFSRNQVQVDSLYTYSNELQRFTGSPGEYIPKGIKYWAVWGFNADWVIICSSEQIMTDFQ